MCSCGADTEELVLGSCEILKFLEGVCLESELIFEEVAVA